MGSVRTRWRDKEFEQKVLNPRIVRWLFRIGARGEALAKHIISGGMGAGLRAVDKGRLMNSLTFEVDAKRQIVRIGTNVLYAIHVFMGTFKMLARPVLRTMLAMLRVELR